MTGSLFAAYRWLCALLRGDTSTINPRDTAIVEPSRLPGADPLCPRAQVTRTVVVRCVKCSTAFVPHAARVDGVWQSSLQCARCGKRPLAGRTRAEAEAATEKMKRHRGTKARNIIYISNRRGG